MDPSTSDLGLEALTAKDSAPGGMLAMVGAAFAGVAALAVARRDLQKVIDVMLTKIPLSETRLRKRLEDIHYKYTFRAPEVRVECWSDGEDALRTALGPNQTPGTWQADVLDIWANRIAPPCWWWEVEDALD